MKSRGSIPKLKLAIGSAFVLLVALAVSLSIHRYRQPPATPPEALAHIAQKNRDAAITAAARMRADSAARTNAAESLAEAQDRGSAEANAVVTRVPDTDNRTGASGRRD